MASAFPGPSSVEGSRKNSVLAIAILVAIFGDVLQIEFLNGQVNLIVVALMMAAVYFGDDRPHLGAALLGAAVALKLTPAILLVYWVVRRRPRFVAEAIAWGAGFILLPWLVVRGRLWTLYESYAREFILPRTGAAVHQREFFSVHGLAGWLTGETPGRVLMVALAAAVVLALVLWHRRLLARGDASFAPVASVYIAAMPLLSPMSEVHHLTAALPAAAYAVSASGHRTRVRYDVVAALAVFTVLIWIARFDRRGPWYFLALASVIAAAAFALRGDSSQN